MKKKANRGSVCNWRLELYVFLFLSHLTGISFGKASAPFPSHFIEITESDLAHDYIHIQCSYFADTTQKQGIEDVKSFSWKTFTGKELSEIDKNYSRVRFSFNNDNRRICSNLWRLIQLRNTTDMTMSFYVTDGKFKDAYHLLDDGSYSQIQFNSGWKRWWFLMKSDELEGDSRSLLFYIPPRGEISILTKSEILRGEEKKTNYISLRKESDFVKDRFEMHGINRLLLGAIVILLLYNLLIFFTLRKKIYLYFFIYLFFMLLFNLDDDLLVFMMGKTLFESGLIYVFFIASGLCAYILFVRNFFKHETFYQGFFMRRPIKVICFWFCLQIINLWGLFPLVDRYAREYLGKIFEFYFFSVYAGLLVFCLIVFVVILFKVIRLRLKNESNAGYVLFGNIAVIAAFIFSFINLAFLDLFNYDFNPIVFSSGFFVEGLSFSVGITRKINQLQQEKEEEQLRSILTLEGKVEERTRELRMEKLNVEEKNREILDSIEYARRIQSAILPPPRVVQSLFKDSFILYLPKDIVAGDFYWMERVDDRIYFAACDCTGHGVPGALVSVVCNTAMNRALIEFGEREPGKILEKARELVIENFARSDEYVQDGMDVSLACLLPASGKLYWAGANNHLWIFRKDRNLIEEWIANKQAVGLVDLPLPFTTREIDLEPGDIIFLYTDGYADQFGGAHGKKLTRKKFMALLNEIAVLPMEEQKRHLLEFHQKYKGNEEQVDDICVMGVRV